MDQQDEQEGLNALRELNKSKQLVEIEHNNLTESAPDQPHQHHSHSRPDPSHQHSRAAAHGQPHGHSKQKNHLVIYYTVFTCISCLYLETQHLNPLVGDSQSRYLSWLCYFDVLMSLWSYFQTICISSGVEKLTLKQDYLIEHVDKAKTYDPAFDLLKRKCEKCDYFKFPRVSHCTTCGKCIYKMDHHCIWTQTCIGYCNQRSFYLFCMYMTIGVLQFWYTTLRTSSIMFGSCQFFSFFEPGVYILWMVTCVSAGIVGVMIIALLVGNSLMIPTNHTSLDSIKTKTCFPLPFFEFRKKFLSIENVSLSSMQMNRFDRGEVQNLKSLFGDNILTCWMPLRRDIMNEFMFEQMNPYPSPAQIAIKEWGIVSEADKKLSEVCSNIKSLYAGSKMVLDGRIIEVE